MESRFKVGDKVIVSNPQIEGSNKPNRVGEITHVDLYSPYPYNVRFSDLLEDYGIFSDRELDHAKNYIVTQLLKDL